MIRFMLPLVAFLAMAIFLFAGLSLNPRQVPSPLIDKPAPDFTMQQLHNSEMEFASKDNLGKVWLLNVWASWCAPCRDEHPLLVQVANAGIVPVYGINYKDDRDTAIQWLRQLGDPYTVSVVDPEGRVGIDYGVYGVPETYVIDKQGIIRHKQIGPVTVKSMQETILPLVKELQGQS
jgi:cytochrome c biogenesis protein CcmG/thiol:disulfide interchange protein DsbE